MYLPHRIPLSSPHVAAWFGLHGKQYNFAVARARPMWLGQPAVYVLVRCAGSRTEPLFVGLAGANDPELGGAGSDGLGAWEQALALGMTHVHLRFEACSDAVRRAEVDDLAAALGPPLNRGPEAASEETPGDAAFQKAQSDPVEAPAAVLSPSPPTASATDRAGPMARIATLRRSAVERLGGLLMRLRPKAPALAEPVASDRAALLVDPVEPIAGGSMAAPAAVGDKPAAAESESASVDRGGDGGRCIAGKWREEMGFGDDGVVILFAGELSHQAGADRVVQAMATVAGDVPPVRLVLVGEGPLRGDLEDSARLGGYAHTCRFLGHLPAVAFADVLAACDAVVIPARAPQDPSLAALALAADKAVLTTHQAGLGAIVHGENGLVTYDNPGSLVWVLREARSLIARRHASAVVLAA